MREFAEINFFFIVKNIWTFIYYVSNDILTGDFFFFVKNFFVATSRAVMIILQTTDFTFYFSAVKIQ